MKNYLFTDCITEKDFIVQANTNTEAFDIARKYFERPKSIGIITEKVKK